MARTEIRSTQIKQLTVLVDDFRDFGPEDGGSLNLNIKAGRIRDDNTITDKAAQVVALTDNTTNFVELSPLGVASANTSAFNSGSVPIAQVVTSGGSISTITDKRAWIATDASSGSINSQLFTATAGQTVFTLTEFTYTTGAEELLVFSGGLLMRLTEDYVETSSTVVTFNTGRELDENIILYRIRPGSGTGAPTDAQYVTLATDGTLSDERVLTAGNQIDVTDAGAGSTVTVAVKDISARIGNSTSTSISNNTLTTLSFDNVGADQFDTDSIHNPSVNPARLTATTAGKYLVVFQGEWPTNTGGPREFRIRKNGGTSIAILSLAPSIVAETRMIVTTLVDLAQNDFVIVQVLQGSGGSLNLNTNGSHSPVFSMVKVG